jgi:hypothetical protein
LREATSLVHWYGRHLEGRTTVADINGRFDRLLRLELELSGGLPDGGWGTRVA